jgi:ABC-2 type transport system permease protein
LKSIVFATFIRNQRLIQREFPWAFIVERLLIGCYTSLFSYFIYVFMFKGNLNDSFSRFTGHSDYMTFSILGVGVYSLAVSTLMSVGRTLMNEYRDGTLEMLFLSPTSRIGYFLGIFFEQLGRSILEFLVIIVFGVVLGANLTQLNIVSFLAVFIISICSFFCMSIFLASLMIYMKDTFISQNTLFYIMSFVCGIAYPIQYLPNWIQIISHFFPLTSALALYREIVIKGGQITNHLDLCMEITILSVAYFYIGITWLSKIERKYIEEIG